MKISKFFSGVFAVLGTVLLVGTVVLCLISLDAEPRLAEVPEAAREGAIAVVDALCQGDFSAAGSMMYGQPDLGADREPADAAGALIWDAFVGSLSYTLSREPSVEDSGVVWTVTVDALDISAVTASLEERAQALLRQRAETAEDAAALYDAENNFREDVVEEALLEAVAQALSEDAETVSREGTLKMIQRDGRWWAVPDQALLQAVSGGVA